MPEHFCSACGQEHTTGKSPEVRIAEINAQRDVEIARMEYRGDQEAAVLEAETAVTVTELETTADVAVAEETEPPPAPAEDPADNQAIVVEGPPAEPEHDAPPPPEAEHENHVPQKKQGFF